MKVSHAQNNVLGSEGLQETGGFKILANAHAFKMLSSGLYSDKVRAVLREIGCNAMDAHIAAGDPNKPFRVKIPNALDDQFYIQDWGPGLSHDEVMHLYTTYFASTKQTSNDFTGAFGLGSKSPFSYIDSFNVVSVHEGKKRTYTLYLDNNGAPTVSLMATEDADRDWRSGVRVGFAVKPEDVYEFQEKAKEVFKWFRVSPEMRGVEPIERVKFRFECDDFALIEGGERGVATALMGNVAYPLDLEPLGVTDIGNEKDAATLINYAGNLPGLVLKLSIGDSQVAASRERLQYDKVSLAKLKDKLEMAVRRAGKEVVESLEIAADGGWTDLCRATERVGDILDRSGIGWQFEGFAKAMGIDAKRAKKLAKFIGKDTLPVARPKTPEGLFIYVVRMNQRDRPVAYTEDSRRGHSVDIEPESAILAGCPERAMSRAKRAVEDGHFKQVLVVARRAGSKLAEPDVMLAAQAISEEMGRMPVRALSDFQPYDQVTTAKKRKPKNWQPSLPVGVQYDVVGSDGKQARAELGSIDPLFMVQRVTRRWNNETVWARVYNTTADEDRKFEWSHWQGMWSAYSNLQKSVQLPNAPSSYAVLSAGEVREIAIPRLGWKTAFDAIKEYINRPELRDAVRAKVKKKHLLAAESDRTINSWMTGLSFLLAKDHLMTGIEKRLKALGLEQQLRDMWAARQKAKRGDDDVPPEIRNYQWLCTAMDVQDDDLGKDLQAALTVEDLDAGFVERFPRSKLISLNALLWHHREHLNDTLEFILAKEA